VFKTYFKRIKQEKFLWLAPIAMLVAFVLPDSFIILKFLLVTLALGLFYNTITSKHTKGFVK
jgi:hypothetical protein